MKNETEKYGLFTAITMIVGICVGSGIFFKADDILIDTNGSILHGVLLFVVAATAIIFGSLTTSILAKRTDKPGGIITYAEEFIGERFGYGVGWFYTLIYYPAITGVITWVIAIYIDILFNLGLSLGEQILLGYGIILIMFIYNVVTPRLGGYLQDLATIIKLIPLLLLGFLGLFFGDPINGLANASTAEITSAGFLTALGPIAFSFDGWICSTSISHEIKNSKKNLPLALTIAPLVILAVYIIYFVGVSLLVGPEQVMALGDAHVSYAAELVFGTWFSKAITVFVVISVAGTLNGVVLTYIRMPYHLATRNAFYKSDKLKKINSKFNMPVNASILAFIILSFWILINYILTKYQVLGNSDVSEISVSVSYLFYLALYYKVFKLYKEGEIKSKFEGIFLPVMATIGSLIILSGAIQVPFFIYYILVSAVVVLASQIYYKRKRA